MSTRRILFVSTTEPDDRSYGAALRSGVLLQALERCGEVSTLVMTPDNATRLVAPAHGTVLASLRFRHRVGSPKGTAEVRRLVAEALAGRQFDLVVVRYLLLGLYVRPLVGNAPVILDADDLSKRHAPRAAPKLERLRAALRGMARDAVARLQLRRYAHVWFVHRDDMTGFPVRSGSLLPNIAAPAAPRERAAAASPRERFAPASKPTVLFVGNLEYGPNVHAIDWFTEEVWPTLHAALPEARLRIVGKRWPAQAERWNAVSGAESPGFVDDLAAEYARASLVVAPVFSGGGTQIKVLEALAHGCAVVVSDFVAAGFAPELRDGGEFVVARAPAEWVARCVELIADPQRAAALGATGREAVRRHYSAEQVARTVEATVAALSRRAERQPASRAPAVAAGRGREPR